MSDQFQNISYDIEAPAQGGAALTPSDSVNLPQSTRAVYVGVGGDLKVTLLDGSIVTYTALPQGITKAIRVIKVWSTGTTATNLVGEW
jgi:hypothetical protein